MTHKYSILFRWINVIVDYCLLNGILYACFITTNHDLAWLDVYDYRLTILLLNFCWFYSSNIFDIYSYILKRDAILILNANLGALCIFSVLAALIKLTLPELYIPPTPFIYYFALFPFLILVWRFLFLLLRRHYRKSWIGYNKIVIIGSGSVGIDFHNYISSNPHLNYRALGIFDDDPKLVPPYINYLGCVDECLNYANANNIKEIYCALPQTECERIERLMQEADDKIIRFRIVPDIKGIIHKPLLVDMFGFVPVLKPRPEPLENKANEIAKRTFDIVFSLLVIILGLSWLTPILALIIKLDSKGPVFFVQLRSGKNNKPFYCLKFRSMVVNSESDSKQAIKGDERVTRVGRIIRKTSIDELPQFINVLLGHMSVVGPRPHMLKQTVDYSQVINSYMVRHFLTPGITGWAQVNGYRGETRETSSMFNRIKADLWYLENWSILLDMKIIFLTIWQLLKFEDDVY
ncbi:undecaprenyl-phosphate glucose phosphotransferase [Pontibacter sp. KCTC 32443]|uniref:undecaprenyl-phosphate glucose phosphotransferase n=1 Tax=Pontibacter TaxID=323449 RepID=UPI00164D52EE|nr:MULTISPECIES: undecaprenyl-phosphate glucose phosphotransferase [Pontibacter]MBC5774626.1 undecaprenyl-phosphate glucose phosphotransferase [Pontibacter sp. KCTC 32443]